MAHVRRVFRPALLLATAATAGALLAGCGEATVDRSDLEREIGDRLTEAVGVAPERVECPDELAAKVDASVRCVLTAPDGSRIGLTVTVTTVNDDTVDFDIVVDPEPLP